MAFGAKVKLTVDKSNQKGFRDEIQGFVDNATKKNPLKIQDVKITLSKKGQDELRRSIQEYLDMDKNGLEIHVNKIDAKNAIKNFRSELETMLSGLSITGLKDFLGVEGVEKTFEKAAEASKKAAEAQNKSETKSTLQSLQKDIETTYKNNKVTTSPFIDDLTKQYKELNSELERTQKLEGEAQQAAIKALSTRVDGFKELVNTSHSSQKVIKDIQTEIDAAYKKNAKTTDPSQSTVAANMYQNLYSDIENVKTLEGEAQQAAIAGIRERATEFKKYINLIQGGQQTVKLLETELNNAFKNGSKLTGTEGDGALSKYSEISNEIANVKNLEGAELESAVANISAKTNALKEYIRTTYESQEASRIAANEEEKAAQKTLATLKKVNAIYSRGTNYLKQNPHVAESSYGVQINSLLSTLGSKTNTTEEEALNAERNLNLFIKAARDAGLEGKRFGDRVLEAYKKFGGWTTVTRTLTFIIQKFKQLVTTVIELDTAMTELRKVTDLSETEYMQFFDTAITRAKTLGATITDVINSTADFARLGYSIGDASELANAAIVYKNVGDGIEDINAASESIISTLKAFGQENLSAMDIVDKFNKVGNEFAISSKGVGDAMQRSSAALAAAGNTIDESIALAVGMNSVLQDPDKVGTVLKTASMYLRAAKTDAEDAGIATDGMAHSVSELRKEILKITDNQVDIMFDNNTFKSTVQQYRELAEVYGKLTDVDQANLLDLIGGKRNATANAALLTNFKDVEEALEASSNASGSALKENEKFLDSVAGKIKSLQIAFQELATTVISSDFLKGFIENLTKLLSGLNSLIDTFGALPPLITTVGTALGMLNKNVKPIRVNYDENGNKDGFAIFGTQIKDVNKHIKEYNSLLSDIPEARSNYIESIQEENVAVKKYLTQVDAMNVKGAQTKASLRGMALEMVKTTAKTYLLEAGIFALNAAISMGISALISGVIWGLSKLGDSLITTQQEVKETAEEALAEYKNITQELEDSKKTIDEIAGDYEKLSKGVDEFGNNISLSTDEYARYNEIVNKIADMFPQMVQGYTDEDNAIVKHKGNVEALTEAYNDQKKAAEDAVITSAGAVFENFRNETTVGFWENTKNEFLNAIGKGMPTDEDIEILKRAINKNITNDDIFFNGFAFTRIKNAIIAAGIEEPRGGETDSLYVKRIADEYPHILQSILSTIETENAAALSEIRPIIDIYIERNTEYRALNKEQKDAIKKIVGSLGYEFFNQYKSVEDSITAIVDKYIVPLQNSDFTSGFDIVLNAQTKFNNNEIPVSEYQDSLNNFLTKINNLPEETQKEFRLLFGIQTNEDGSTTSSLDAMIENVKNKVIDEDDDFVRTLFDEELKIAEKIAETNLSQDELRKKIDEIKFSSTEATEALDSLGKQIDNIQSAYKSAKSAIEEYNATGFLSVDTLQSLLSLEPKYLNMLLDEEGNLNLSTDALKNNTAALIDNMGIQAAKNLIDSMKNYTGEAEQLEYLTGATNEATGSTWDFVYAQLAQMATVSSPAVMQALYDRIDTIRQMTELTKQGIGSGGLDSSVTDTKEKLEDLNKKVRLDSLKHEISTVELSMEQLKATLDSLSESFDNLFEGDYIGKQEILSKQFEIAIELGKQYREEFERLAQIQPQSADEANELANRLENLGSSIRDNAHSLIEYNKQINELRISAISGYGENVAAQLDRELELINNNLSSISEGSVFGDNFSFDFLFPSIPESAIEKQRKQNKELLEEEEKHNDEIYEIKRKALELEKEENDKARKKERASLIESLEFNKNTIISTAKSTAEEVSNTAIDVAKTTSEIVKEQLKSAIDEVEKSLNEFSGSPISMQGLQETLKIVKGIFNDETSTETELESAIALLTAAIQSLDMGYYPNPDSSNSRSGITGTGGGSAKNPFLQYGVTSDMQNNRTVMGQTRAHKGVDYGLPSGTPVIAPVSGTVMTGIDPNGFGNYVVVTDSKGYQQWFGHLSKSYSNLNGQYVKAGTVIGLSGNSGRSTGAHLHYEIRTPNGGRLHPDAYLAQRANGGIVGKGETTLVNELGQESAILPNGKFVLLGNEAKLVDMPIGTQVINHKDTADILKYTGSSINNTPIQKLASGNTKIEFLETQLSGHRQVLTDEYQKVIDWGLESYLQAIKDGTVQSVFGNIDMDKRTIITWSEELKKTYQDELASWEYDPEVGGIDTVFGGSGRFGEDLNGDGWEVAFTPILPDGTFLSRDTVYEYINNILSEAYSNDGQVTEDELKSIDIQGRQIGETFVKGIFAAVDSSMEYNNNGNWAETVGRLMHFSGDFGAVEIAQRDIEYVSKAIEEATNSTSISTDTSSSQETNTVVVNADTAEVKADTSTVKELEAWIEKYTTSSSYNTYSSEFHKAYTNYLAHRQGLSDEIEDLKKRRDLLDIGSAERKNLESQIRSKAIALDEYDINEGYDTQIAMVESSATKLNQAYNDLLWEYTQAIGRGESAEVLKLYQDGLAEISDQMNSVDEHWKSIHESQKEYLISVAEEVGRAFDSIYKEADRQIEDIEDKIENIESLRDPASVSTKFSAYKEKMSAAEEGYNHAISEQEMHHVAAEEARRQYSSISGKYDTDSWFDIDGELNLNYKRDLAMMSSEELKKAEKLAEILQVHKQGYYEAGEAAKDYKDLFTETNNAMYEEAQNIEKEAVEQIVEMIEYRKEKELEAIEEIHEKTVELLDERRKIIEDMYSRQLELLDDVKTEEDYHRELNEETDKLNQIQLEINKYSLIDTSAARTKVSELQKQLEEQQKVIDEKQREKEYQDKKEALEEDRDLLLDSLDQKVEDENDAYDAIKEAIEDRYEEEKVYAEAMEAYQTGKLATFVEKSATAYDQIGTDATLEIKGIGEAFDDFFVDTGLSIDNFTKNEMLTWLNSFTPVKQALEEIIELQTEAFNFGQGSANSEDGSAWETTLNRLQTENGFGWSEIQRTQTVIDDLTSKKQDTADQWEYLRYLVDFEKNRTLNVIAARKASGEEISQQEDYLRTICSIFGDSIPTYHTGRIPNWLSKNEELSIIKDDETVLTKSMTESLLSKVSTLEILKEKLIPKLGGFVSNLPTLNNHTSTIGDIHITIQANEVSKIDRRMLNAWGNDIMNNIKTEFGFSS